METAFISEEDSIVIDFFVGFGKIWILFLSIVISCVAVRQASSTSSMLLQPAVLLLISTVPLGAARYWQILNTSQWIIENYQQ